MYAVGKHLVLDGHQVLGHYLATLIAIENCLKHWTVKGRKMVTEACSQLLSSTESRQPLYGNRLANHLPMVLIALDRMCATSEQMHTFASAYQPKLQMLTVIGEAQNPKENLGSGRGFEGALRYFREMCAQNGVEYVLRQWVPILTPGLAASAFHAFIRLAYAVEAENESEVCFALAYWATEYCPLSLSMSTIESTPEAIVADLTRAVIDHRFGPGIIIDRMTDIAAHPIIRGSHIQPKNITLSMIVNFALSAHIRNDDFATLHMITSCHAFRVIQKYFDDHTLALRYLWEAIAIAYLTTERVDSECRELLPKSRKYSWSNCIENAKRSSDDHMIKLTYTAWQESLEYKDDRFLAVASRKNFC